MFQSISLGYFKAFGPTQRIPIRPLTLIFGPNSAGKSSFIHGLLFAHEAHTSDALNSFDVKRPRLGGDSVDLGGFRQFIHRGDLENRVEWGVELDASQLSGHLAELLTGVKSVRVTATIGQPDTVQSVGIARRRPGEPLGEKEVEIESGPRVETYEIATGSTLLLRASLKRGDDGWELRVDQLDSEHPVMRTMARALIETHTTSPALKPNDYTAIRDAIDKAVRSGITLVSGKFLPCGARKSGESFGSGATHKARMLFALSQGNREEELASAVTLVLPQVLQDLVRGLEVLIGDRLKQLKYLGPLRSYPPRHLAFSEDHNSNWYAGGGYAWDRVRTDTPLRERVNQWLGASWMKTPYRLLVRDLYSEADLEDPFLEVLTAVEDSLLRTWERQEFTELEPPRVFEDHDEEFSRFRYRISACGAVPIQDLVLVDVAKKTVVSHRDVGIGVSQVLPVLVSAFAADNECVAIEQPEIHLHPALQAELGDVFINSALGGKQNTFLLETHSEHLILRIMRRIRETTAGTLPDGCQPIRPDDVTVIYVEPNVDGSLAREMPLNELGVLVKAWPGGFFEEGLREVF